MENITIVSINSLRMMPENTRDLFFYLILTISIIALIGNILALKSIARRKIKYLQKVSIISLAVADIFAVLMFATNNIESLSKELKTWTLGEFFCYLIPTGQVLGTTMSALCLLVIASDRYRSLSSVIGKKWNPNMLKSSVIMLTLWIIGTGISIPMVFIFNFLPIYIYSLDGETPVFERADMCIAVPKENIQLYYTTVACIIFFPLVIMFTWYYYKVAKIIWKHRTPQSNVDLEQSTTKECSSVSDITAQPNKKKVKNVQLERKIRTFKIILVLLITFVVCRLPYWIYYVVALSQDIRQDLSWNLHYSFITLNLLNCALNPFLYTFLNQSITALEALKQLIWKLLSFCCCFSNSDFDQFTKYNPFEVDPDANKNEGGTLQKRVENSNPKNHIPSLSIHVTEKKINQ